MTPVALRVEVTNVEGVLRSHLNGGDGGLLCMLKVEAAAGCRGLADSEKTQ